MYPRWIGELEQGGWTVSDIARFLNVEDARVKVWKKGAPPDPRTGMEFSRLRSRVIQRRGGLTRVIPPPWKSLAPHPAPDGPLVRGVYRERLAPKGEQWYKVVTSAGEIGTVRLPESLCGADFDQQLWRRLDSKDPQKTQLKAL